MSAIYLVLASVTLYSIGSIVRKTISAIDENLNYLSSVIFQILGGVTVLIASLLLGFQNEYTVFLSAINPYLIVKIIIGSALWFWATVTSFQALNTITASKFSIIEALSPLVSISLAFLLLGESFTQNQFIGTTFILVSVFIVVYDKNEKLSHLSKGEMIAFLSTTLNGLALVNDKGIYAKTPLIPTLTIMFILPGLLGLAYKPSEIRKLNKITKNKNIVKQLIIMGGIWGIAAILYYKAIVISNSISLVVSIAQLSTVLTVILGLLLLKETENWVIKILASIVSVLGLIFMSI